MLPLFNTVVSWFLKKRKHQMELFLKYPIDVQQELLRRLIGLAQDTEFGRQYDFKSIYDYRTFAERVPIQKYESIEPLIERTRKGEQNVFLAKYYSVVCKIKRNNQC